MGTRENFHILLSQSTRGVRGQSETEMGITLSNTA
uniref:Uncharacterized protein n=1 Tax=Anguilla anguilla TaxID=7936 RepID=A0A0E9R2T1_ANGAN